MSVFPSKTASFFHKVNQPEEILEGIPFRHAEKCPFLDPTLSSNPQSVAKPCVVVLIQNKHTKKILATQRHEHMSFGNKWVLPGGHLEADESVINGGLRECQEEVGLSPEHTTLDTDKLDMFAWESVLVDHKQQKIKRAALVLFIRVQCEHFEVVEQKSEVKAWEWRSFEPNEEPWGGGWAEGHLQYLRWASKQ
jgi:8-oxo-dGTP pyrophosphatase MutT (NUDIX family)